MATKNPRINITLEPSTVGILGSIADEEHKSLASIAKDLILEALDRREDRTLSALAESRDTRGQKTVSHKDVWK